MFVRCAHHLLVARLARQNTDVGEASRRTFKYVQHQLAAYGIVVHRTPSYLSAMFVLVLFSADKRQSSSLSVHHRLRAVRKGVVTEGGGHGQLLHDSVFMVLPPEPTTTSASHIHTLKEVRGME